jgi:pseudouridine-5'-phosphate glycosidase
MDRSSYLTLPEVAQALATNKPVVALESTVITHGLPYPQNLQLANDMEDEVRKEGAVPATIAILAGKVHIGLQPEEVADLATRPNVRKISGRDFGAAVAQGAYGGTTVAGTLIAAHTAGILVFATGGIGGVHRQASYDVSADLIEMSRTPLVVVCAGAKAILDLSATMEMLETLGVPVIGYRTDTLPAFYSTSSGLPVSARVESPEEAAAIARAHWGMNLRSTILVVQPPPEEAAIPEEKVSGAIQQALDEASEKGIHGQAVTPFLLGRVSELTGGESLKANLALLRNNARLAAQIAKYL